MAATLDRPLIDLEADDLRPVATVARDRTGKRPSPASIWRWIHKGNRGGKLEAVFLTGVWHTTAAAFADFIRRQTAAALGASDRPSQGVTDDELRANGLLP